MPKCKFEYASEYAEGYGKNRIFECPENAVVYNNITSDYCIFHDYVYHNMNEDNYEFIQRFQDALNQKIKKPDEDGRIYLVGYHFPPISFNEDVDYPIYFDGSMFDSIDFSGTFSKKASFTECTFLGSAKFFGCLFSEEADFSLSTFEKVADFDTADFEGPAYFDRVKFLGDAEFSGTTFNKLAMFGGAKFSDNADMRANFLGEAEFLNSSFDGDTGFPDFYDTATFIGCDFNDKVSFLGNFADLTVFRHANFNEAKKVLFFTSDLSQLSFMNCDISRVIFPDTQSLGKRNRFKIREERMIESGTNCVFNWEHFLDNEGDCIKLRNFLSEAFNEHAKDGVFKREKNGEITLKFSNEFVIYSDSPDSFKLKKHHEVKLWLDKEKNKGLITYDKSAFIEFSLINKRSKKSFYLQLPNVESVMQIYRALRESAEFQLRYDEAGNFFVREMELKRKYKIVNKSGINLVIKNNIIRRTFSLTGIYYYFAKYGQAILNPAILSCAVLVLGFLFWSFQIDPRTVNPSSKF